VSLDILSDIAHDILTQSISKFEYVCASKVNLYIILTGVPVAPDGERIEGMPSGGSGGGGQGIVGGG